MTTADGSITCEVADWSTIERTGIKLAGTTWRILKLARLLAGL